MFRSSILFSLNGVSSRSIRLHLPLGEKGKLVAVHTLSCCLSTGWRYQYKIRWWSTATSESVLGAAASQLSCCCVSKGLKLEEDLIKPNPTKSVHWLKLSQARGIATVLMYGERRKHIEISKDYARGKTSGLARVESVTDLVWKHQWNVGQLRTTDTTRIQHGYLHDVRRDSCSLGRLSPLLQEKSAQEPFPAVASRVSFLVGVEDTGEMTFTRGRHDCIENHTQTKKHKTYRNLNF